MGLREELSAVSRQDVLQATESLSMTSGHEDADLSTLQDNYPGILFMPSYLQAKIEKAGLPLTEEQVLLVRLGVAMAITTVIRVAEIQEMRTQLEGST